MKSSEFKLLVIPFSSRLYRLAFSLLGNREEAEDAVQEVYLKLWKMRSDLKNYKSIEALCVRVTRNQCLDYLRRRQKTREVQEDHKNEKGQVVDTPSEVMEKKERSEIINKLINQLPEPQRSLVFFRHVEGKEYHEIEELMDMNENAIRVSISRARKRLREMLQKHYVSWTN
jgi:RNA polymerase sigma-70 factor (ECF subfamily)